MENMSAWKRQRQASTCRKDLVNTIPSSRSTITGTTTTHSLHAMPSPQHANAAVSQTVGRRDSKDCRKAASVPSVARAASSSIRW